MKIGEFIQKYMNKNNMSQAELARRSGVPASTISSIIIRNNDRVAIEMVLKLCEVLECDIEEYISSLKKEKIRQMPEIFTRKYYSLDDFGQKTVNAVLDLEYERCTNAENNSEVIEIKHSYYKVSAGLGFDLDDDNIWETINIPDTPESRKADFALTIKGDSMEPVYFDGDIVLVKSQEAIDVGEIGIYTINGAGYIKKYGGDRLISLNANYNDILFTDYDTVTCCGKVIGRI